MEKKRVFLALPIDPVFPVVERMKQLQKQLQSDYRIKWVRSENLHLTLFFFGEIDVTQIPELIEIIHSVVQFSSDFSFSLLGTGIFKKGKEPRVLWLGVKAPDQLFEIKSALDKSMEVVGIFPTEKLFRPHLSLGRFRQGQGILPVLESLCRNPSSPLKFEASKIILYESRLFPAGPLYVPIEVFPLKSQKEENEKNIHSSLD